MWLLYVLAHSFLLALVNYIDTYLTANNTVPSSSNLHRRIGGLLVVSMLFCAFGALALWAYIGDPIVAWGPLLLAVASAAPLAVLFGAYFYLLALYPAHQVVPLFLISSVWLLGIEVAVGGSVTLLGICGVLALMAGSYLLDAGSFRLQVPTKLLAVSVFSTAGWAAALFMIRMASDTSSAITASFWQLVGLTAIGAALFVGVREYREGFLSRVRNQGKKFLGLSLVNETLSQGAYVLANLAVAIAQVAAYVTALAGVQSLFVLVLFFLFPLGGQRTSPSRLQAFSVLLMALGAFLIEMA